MGVYTTYYLQYNAKIINLIYIQYIIILITRRFKYMKWGGGRGRQWKWYESHHFKNTITCILSEQWENKVMYLNKCMHQISF